MGPKYTHQVNVALEMYLKRGKEALKKLRSGDLDNALEILSLRKAAFYNFRTAEHLARFGENYHIGQDYKAIKAYEEIGFVNKEIKIEIERILAEVDKDVKVCSSNRKKIGRFHSGNKSSMLFQESV